MPFENCHNLESPLKSGLILCALIPSITKYAQMDIKSAIDTPLFLVQLITFKYNISLQRAVLELCIHAYEEP